jgi:PAS domain S-box-containing protein
MAMPLRVLLVEDDEDHAVLIERELRRSGFSLALERVDTSEALAQALDRQEWDIVLTDYNLPRFDALTALGLVQERAQDLPVILVSGAIGEETAAAALRAGAKDYIRKGNWARLAPAIERELQEAENRRHHRLAEEERTQLLERERVAHTATERALEQLRDSNRQLADANRLLQEMTVVASQERDRLGQVIELLPAGIAIANSTGTYVLANAAARDILGFDPTGQPIPTDGKDLFGARFVAGTAYPPIDLPIQRALTHGETVRDVQLIVCNATTGRDIALLVNGAPLRDSLQAVVGGIVVFQDITTMRDLDRAREEFLASAAHDLQNPLTGIKGHAQLLRRQIQRAGRPDQEWVLPSLERVEVAATQMSRQIGELLDVARLRINQPLDLFRESIDVVALTRQLAEEESLAADRHRVVVETAEITLVGFWDRRRLERVLRNLLTNAIKYSPAGGTITVIVARESTNGIDEATITVVDSGIGIPAADQRSIFERFHRGSNVVGTIQGTGLGLASARQIVEQHGGTISVASEEGKGATFTIRLPIASDVRSPDGAIPVLSASDPDR